MVKSSTLEIGGMEKYMEMAKFLGGIKRGELNKNITANSNGVNLMAKELLDGLTL